MSLTAPVGRSVAIVGPSGSGKSTLLSLVLGPGVPLLVSGGFGVLAYQILPTGMDKITGTTDEFAALWHPSSAFTAAALMLTVVRRSSPRCWPANWRGAMCVPGGRVPPPPSCADSAFVPRVRAGERPHDRLSRRRRHRPWRARGGAGLCSCRWRAASLFAVARPRAALHDPGVFCTTPGRSWNAHQGRATPPSSCKRHAARRLAPRRTGEDSTRAVVSWCP